MKPNLVMPTLALALLPIAADAGDLSFGGGVSLATNALSDGLSESGNGPSVLTYGEVTKNGFFAGLAARTIKDDAGNRGQLAASFGYRRTLATGLGYELGYTQTFLDNTSGSTGELSGSLSMPLTDRLTVSSEVNYDIGERLVGGNLGAEYALSDVWTVSVFAGRADRLSSPFRGAAVAYDLNDKANIELQYQDTTTTPGLVALSVNYRFGPGGE